MTLRSVDSPTRWRGGAMLFATILTLLLALPSQAQIYKIGLIMARNQDQQISAEILQAATTAFHDSKRFDIIERARLDAIFTEKDLQDFINGTHGDLSTIEGIDMLGLVSYTAEQTDPRVIHFYIEVRLTMVESARVWGTVTSRRETFLAPDTPFKAGQYLLENIREEFPPEGYVLSVSDEKIIIDLGLESGLKKGDELEVIREGEVMFHPVTGDRLPAVEDVVAVLKVKNPNHQMSDCKVKKKLLKRKETPTIEIMDRVRLRPKNELLRTAYNKIIFARDKVKDRQ